MEVGVLSTLRTGVKLLRTILLLIDGPEDEIEGVIRLVVAGTGFLQLVERIARNLRS